jgi:aminoglycoside 3-N-acetyltransferase
MGTVIGGPEAIFGGMRDAVGPEGTVAAPTLCNWKKGEEALVFPNWDPATTPCYVGVLPELFRKQPGAIRSNHATHSVAAIGKRAAELTEGHGDRGRRLGPYGDGAFAASSPWERLYQWNAAYCFIGVTYRSNTMVHYVESRIVERALERAPSSKRAALAAEVSGWMKDGVWAGVRNTEREQFEKMQAELGIVRYGKIGSATLRCARAKPMVDHWIAVLEADPERWFNETFLAWLGGINKWVN